MAQKKVKNKKSPVKKGKVTVSPVGLISLCGGVIIVCLVLLLVTTIAEKSPVKDKKGTEVAVKTEKVEKAEKIVKPEKPVKTEPAKTETKTPEKSSSDSTIDLKELKQARKAAKKEPVSSAKPAESKTKEQEKPQKKEQEPQKTTQTAKKIEVLPQKSETKPEVKPATVPETKPEVKPADKSVITENVKPEPEPKTGPSYTFDFPYAVNHAQLCILLDDGGQNLEDLKKYIGLKIPLTVAVLPKLRDTVSSANAVRAAGLELMLHQPMQAVNLSVNPGPGAIKPDMTSDQIRSLVMENLREVGPVSGMNNHEGSLITADISKMETVIDVAHMQGIYFLDSRTNVETKIPYVSRELGYSWYERNGYFLDNEKTREEFLKELRKNLDIANKTGCVIMIAHVWSANYLPALIREVYPELVAKGYSFTTVGKSRGLKN